MRLGLFVAGITLAQEGNAISTTWQPPWGRQGIPEADSDGDGDVAERTGTLAEVAAADKAAGKGER